MAVNTLAYLSQAQPYKSGKVPDPLAMLSSVQTLKQQEQATELEEKKLSDYEEDRQRKWQLEKGEADRAAAKEADEKISRSLDIRKNAMDWAERLLPKMDYDDYPTFYQEAIANRIDESALPHPKDIKSPEDWTNARADMEAAIRKGRELLGKDTEAVAQIRRWRDEQQAGSTESFLEFKVREKSALERVRAPAAASPLGKLLEERDKLPANSPHAEAYDSAIKQKIEGQPNEIKLTKQALAGDEEAKAILDNMTERKAVIAKASGEAMVEAKLGAVDADGAARAIIEGRETLDNVRNTFGIPVQEYVRKKVLEMDPEFNFNKPRVKLAAVKSSYAQQQKVRGAMGSFVKNLNKQLIRVDDVIQDVIKRVGIRAIDLPMRELKTRFVGSGHEKVLESYMIEISNEIGKLSTGSSASIRELSTDAQERWAKIHDVNLSFKELKHVLDETGIMANMRLESVDEEMDETLDILSNVRSPKKKEKTSRFKILKVE